MTNAHPHLSLQPIHKPQQQKPPLLFLIILLHIFSSHCPSFSLTCFQLQPIYINSSIDPQLTGFRVFCPAPLAPGRKTCAPTRGAVCTLSHPLPVTTFCVTSQSLILLLICVRLSYGPMGPIFGRDVHACHVDPLTNFQPSTCCAWFRAAVSVQSPHMPILK